jgi:3-phenylpropionate/cinnamic acid dioxygenase small subunit
MAEPPREPGGAVRGLSRAEAEDFLYQESWLLDEERLEDWLGLFTHDGCYWIPQNRDDADPFHDVSIAYDDRAHLEARVFRLLHTPVHGQVPPGRTRRFISNVQVVAGDTPTEPLLRANFIVYEARKDAQRSLAGRAEYRLRYEDGVWRIARKTAYLINNDAPIYNLTFIV